MKMANDHKVAVVTGSTGGIGEGTVRRLAADGFAVIVSGRRIAKGEEIAHETTARGGTACFVPADMADPEACRTLIGAAAEWRGGLDVLVNNAGVFPIAEIRDTTVQLWDWVYAVNVRGPFVCAQEAIPHFRKRGWRVNRQHRLHDAFPLPQ
jgi:NAD(P)-dependent dehydrogenase (short-subunit alcohol dehydrogenase family)